MNANSMAIAAFCSRLGAEEEIRPLAPREWGDLARVLWERRLQPADLLSFASGDFLRRLQMSREETERMLRLADRVADLRPALEKLASEGIGVLTRADAEYPPRLRQKLGRDCPPLLYVAGDPALLKKDAANYLGPRELSKDDALFIRRIVSRMASRDAIVACGDGQGADEVAMEHALAQNVGAVVFAAEGLAERLGEPGIAAAARKGALALLSDAVPDGGFGAGAAADRRRYIRAQSVGTVVVRADGDQGPAWIGAMEALESGLCPVYCWNRPDYADNQNLIQKGAVPVGDDWAGIIPAPGAAFSGDFSARPNAETRGARSRGSESELPAPRIREDSQIAADRARTGKNPAPSQATPARASGGRPDAAPAPALDADRPKPTGNLSPSWEAAPFKGASPPPASGIEVKDETVYREAHGILRRLYGPGAEFRPGQYEAIEGTLLNRRTLVVQPTGWGKSLVYFICTRLFRERGRGVSIVVSPLLALMDNQMEAARKLNLRCESLNSSTSDRREEILADMAAGRLDLVLATPESLFKDDIQRLLPQIQIGMFVIDEAHCISDWGHDFRLEYSRLKEVVSLMADNVPLLATTATASDRVVEDLQAQLGGNAFVSRGPLTRSSLHLQVLPLADPQDRLAWLRDNLGKLPGSGIIYCLTQEDCENVSQFLQENGIAAAPYHSGLSQEENDSALEAFRRNRIKALAATIKLGMGYDKPDVAFIVHYQMAKNIVSYYQQIGRAGRGISDAYVFLMYGRRDIAILNHFIDSAFPTEESMTAIYDCVREKGSASLNDIAARLNFSRERIQKCLQFLEKDRCVYKEGWRYSVNPARKYVYQKEHYDAVTAARKRELAQMQELTTTTQCYSQFIATALDDHTAGPCGRCANCLKQDIFPGASDPPSLEASGAASAYLGREILSIEPRKMWAASSATRRQRIEHINQPGICLCRYGQPGFGQLVSQGTRESRFDDRLVARGAQVAAPLIKKNRITHVTCVPSLRNRKVADYARRLANECGLPFVETLENTRGVPQEEMKNSAHQCANAYDSFRVKARTKIPGKVLLVDDTVDSKWTLTACGYRLMESGCRAVYPFALAEAPEKGDG